jgi:hypothetical protein
MLEDGSPLPAVFTEDRSTEGAYKLLTGDSSDHELAGEHHIVFRFNYEHRPSKGITSKAMTVLVIDRCNPPAWFDPQPQVMLAEVVHSDAIIGQD